MRYDLQVLRALLFVLWPTTTLAAAASLGAIVDEVRLADWLVLLTLCTTSGTVALLRRMRKHWEAQAVHRNGGTAPRGDLLLIDWRAFALVHMAGAVFIGFLAFFIGKSYGAEAYSHAVLIALASWQGAELADRWAEKAFGRKEGK